MRLEISYITFDFLDFQSWACFLFEKNESIVKAFEEKHLDILKNDKSEANDKNKRIGGIYEDFLYITMEYLGSTRNRKESEISVMG